MHDEQKARNSKAQGERCEAAETLQCCRERRDKLPADSGALLPSLTLRMDGFARGERVRVPAAVVLIVVLELAQERYQDCSLVILLRQSGVQIVDSSLDCVQVDRGGEGKAKLLVRPGIMVPAIVAICSLAWVLNPSAILID